jgi:hypothetical protein
MKLWLNVKDAADYAGGFVDTRWERANRAGDHGAGACEV